ncbi:MAG: response regulator [Cyanobacteria bacterium LVE1205-1]|jgi:signal transduction histidine kinase/ActR/RegA family two-component response regulator
MVFVVQTGVTVGVISVLTYRSGEQVSQNFASQLLTQVSQEARKDLNTHLDNSTRSIKESRLAANQGIINLSDREQIKQHLWRQIKLNPQLAGIGYYTGDIDFGIAYLRITSKIIKESVSIYRGVREVKQDQVIFNTNKFNVRRYFSTDSQGEPLKLIFQFKHDFRSLQWHKTIQRSGDAGWIPIYLSKIVPFFTLTGFYKVPIGKEKMGYLTTATLLLTVSEFLQKLNFSPNGQVFIIEGSGELIGTSVPAEAEVSHRVNGVTTRLHAIDSKDDRTRYVAQQLLKKVRRFSTVSQPVQMQVQVKGETLSVQMTPYRQPGLNWFLVTMIPTSDLMAEFRANQYRTISISAVALLISLMFAWWVTRRVTQPLQQLTTLSEAIAQGEFREDMPVSNIEEIQRLSHSFRQMVRDLAMGEQLRSTFTKELEQQVKVKTLLLNEAKESAEAANQAKTNFLATMSHELRTPLNVVLGFTQVLQHNPTGLSKTQRSHLQAIYKNGSHLLNLINDILDLTRIEKGHASLAVYPVDLDPFLDSLLAMFRPQASGKGLSLQRISHPHPRRVILDGRKVQQILMNLMDNGIKFTRQGNITLRVGQWGEEDNASSPSNPLITLYIQVEDTGIGMSPSELAQLFQPFTQTNGGQLLKQGVGLGLSISQSLAQLMGGRITVTSELGKGSCLRLEIPCSVATQQPAEYEHPVTLKSDYHPNSHYRILVVDDQTDNRMVLAHLLYPLGLEVMEVSNGTDAIHQWQQWHPHLIFMDLRMPDMDGYEATRCIRELSHHQPEVMNPVIIALTAHILPKNHDQAIAAGCDDFIAKPIQVKELYGKLAHYLGIHDTLISEEPSSLLPSPSVLLESLQSMPEEWTRKLHRAANLGHDGLIMELLTQIPSEHQGLAMTLEAWSYGYDFGRVLELIELTGLENLEGVKFKLNQS